MIYFYGSSFLEPSSGMWPSNIRSIVKRNEHTPIEFIWFHVIWEMYYYPILRGWLKTHIYYIYIYKLLYTVHDVHGFSIYFGAWQFIYHPKFQVMAIFSPGGPRWPGRSPLGQPVPRGLFGCNILAVSAEALRIFGDQPGPFGDQQKWAIFHQAKMKRCNSHVVVTFR